MKLEKPNIDHIKSTFAQMQTREDLLFLLNYAKPLIYGDKFVPFELRQLTYYSNPKRIKNAYKEFKVNKKSGGDRIIHAPVNGLKAIQKTLSLVLQCVFEPHKAAMGFVKDKSIVDNAKCHEGNNYVYNIDLKDFFPSIDQARVWKCLQLRPFNLNDLNINSNSEEKSISTGVRMLTTNHGEDIFYYIKNETVSLIYDKKGNFVRFKKRMMDKVRELKKDNANIDLDNPNVMDKVLSALVKKYVMTDENIKQISKFQNYNRLDLASLIANICCTKMEVERMDINGDWQKIRKNVLPQGAPTSPILTNVVCQRLDYLLTAVAKRFGLKYSRYVDDITFSSLHNVFQDDSPFLTEMRRIITQQGFHIKESKTRLQKDGYRKEVTGLLVNEKVNVQKRYIKQLRMWLYYWEHYGYYRASRFFEKQYYIDKGYVKKGKPNMNNVIGGKLDYLKMVKGKDDPTYLKLKSRFEALLQKDSFIEKILNEWELNGIESARKIYTK